MAASAYLALVLALIALAGFVYAFTDADAGRSKKRLAALRARNTGVGNEPEDRRRQALEANRNEVKAAKTRQRADLPQRLEQAGLSISVRTYWIASGICGGILGLSALLFVHSLLAMVLAAFAGGMGLPRWVLGFLKNRREQAFTREFAPAMDAIVRSVKSGLPVNEALKLVAAEIPRPVSGEFERLTDSLKVGLTMEQSIRRMFQRMPTSEVNFFGIVMAMQSKSGGNLSEALGNLAGVLRDRRRLKDRIRAMSSEAKAGATIIGSLPPGVTLMVYFTTPAYMSPLFHTEIGNLLLIACVLWMTMGVFVMKQMINLKY